MNNTNLSSIWTKTTSKVKTNPEEVPALSQALDLTFGLDANSSCLIGGSVHTSHASGDIAICVPRVRQKSSGIWRKQVTQHQYGLALQITCQPCQFTTQLYHDLPTCILSLFSLFHVTVRVFQHIFQQELNSGSDPANEDHLDLIC